MSSRGSNGRASEVQIPASTLETFLALFPCALWVATSLLSNWVPAYPWYSWASWKVKAVDSVSDHLTSDRAVGRKYAERYLHIPMYFFVPFIMSSDSSKLCYDTPSNNPKSTTYNDKYNEYLAINLKGLFGLSHSCLKALKSIQLKDYFF